MKTNFVLRYSRIAALSLIMACAGHPQQNAPTQEALSISIDPIVGMRIRSLLKQVNENPNDFDIQFLTLVVIFASKWHVLRAKNP